MADETKPIRWGVLGTGVIAQAFARAAATTNAAELVAVGSRSTATAEAFAAEHGTPHTHGSYDAVLADPEVDALYIATPHPDHADWAIAAAQAGKHLLVEKPLTVHAADAERLLDAVSATDRVLVEGFHYRFAEQTAQLVDLLRDGAIGEVRMIDTSFGFHAPYEPLGRLFNPGLGGGGILDVGCYPVSMCVLLARSLGLSTEDVDVHGTARLGETAVDEWAAATLRFGDRLVAQVACAVSCELPTDLRVSGATGSVQVRHPWGADRGGSIVLTRRGHEPETFTAPTSPPSQFTLEVEHVSDLIAAGSAQESPLMPWSDTRSIMHILDAWRTTAGVTHPD